MFSSTTPQRLKPRDKDYFEPDSDGLSLKVRTTGRKIWTVRYWQNGREYRKKIGEYPLMSLLEARRIRDEMKIRVRTGQAAVDVSNMTLRCAAQEWFAQFRAEKSQRHVDTVQYRLEHYIYPVIGQVPIANMARLVFTNLLLSISATGKVKRRGIRRRRRAEIRQSRRQRDHRLARGQSRVHRERGRRKSGQGRCAGDACVRGDVRLRHGDTQHHRSGNAQPGGKIVQPQRRRPAAIHTGRRRQTGSGVKAG